MVSWSTLGSSRSPPRPCSPEAFRSIWILSPFHPPLPARSHKRQLPPPRPMEQFRRWAMLLHRSLERFRSPNRSHPHRSRPSPNPPRARLCRRLVLPSSDHWRAYRPAVIRQSRRGALLSPPLPLPTIAPFSRSFSVWRRHPRPPLSLQARKATFLLGRQASHPAHRYATID